jgi:hypothetical protein
LKTRTLKFSSSSVRRVLRRRMFLGLSTATVKSPDERSFTSSILYSIAAASRPPQVQLPETRAAFLRWGSTEERPALHAQRSKPLPVGSLGPLDLPYAQHLLTAQLLGSSIPHLFHFRVGNFLTSSVIIASPVSGNRLRTHTNLDLLCCANRAFRRRVYSSLRPGTRTRHPSGKACVK